MEQPKFTPDEFRQAQKDLGLSDTQLANLLGLVDGQNVQRMKIATEKSTHRPVRPVTVRLLQAYLDGYRPKDWPLEPTNRRKTLHSGAE